VFAACLLDISVAWGHGTHGLVSDAMALVAFAIIAFAAAALAVYSRFQVVTILIALGAYSAPIGIALHGEGLAGLAAYLFLVSAALLVVVKVRRWEALRFIAWLGAAIPLAIWLVGHPDPSAAWIRLAVVMFFQLLFSLEIFVALSREDPPPFWSLACVLHPSNLMLFAAVVHLLDPVWPGRLGTLCIVAALVLWISAGRIKKLSRVPRQIKRALRLDGAIVLACFAPLQFDEAMVPIVLSAQAVLTAAFCRRFFGPWPATYASGIVFAAMAHVIGHDYFQADMTETWTIAHSFDFSYVILLSAGTALAGYLVAALIAAGRTTGPWEKRLGGALIVLGTALLVYVSTEQSDRFHASWWWMAAAAVWCLAALRFPIAGLVAVCLSMAVTVKFLAWDTLGAIVDGGWAELQGPIRNRAVLTGGLLACLLVVAIPAARRMPFAVAKRLNVAALVKVMAMAAAVVVIWTGTFEVFRVFTFEEARARFAQADLTMQVVLSVFWSASATLLLVVGLARSSQSLRIFAMTLYAIAAVKVLFMDLAYLETVYRVVSFVALGLLMLFASLLYHRLASHVLGATAR
jgi:uncharacterized membrane protein